MQNENTKAATPAAVATVAAKPAATATKAPRKPRIAKPAAKAASDTKADQAAQSAAIASRGLARDAATVVARATNFNQYSDRDTAYLAFFGAVMRANNGKATLAQIHDAGKPVAGKANRRTNPRYTGSAKATDAGAINRLIKAGYITASSDGNTLTATATAKATATYNGKA